MWWFRRMRLYCLCSLSLSQVIFGTLIFFGACYFSLIAGDLFGEVGFMFTLIGFMFLPMIILIMMVVIHDAIVKKREKKITKAEEEIKRQQELEEEVRAFNGKITETLKNSKKEKIIIKEK